MSNKENRRAPRDKHNSTVEIYNEAGDTIAHVARLVDFSKVGVCFSSTAAFALHMRVRLRIRLLREGRLYVSGRIVWTRKAANTNLYGVEFDSVREVA